MQRTESKNQTLLVEASDYKNIEKYCELKSKRAVDCGMKRKARVLSITELMILRMLGE